MVGSVRAARTSVPAATQFFKYVTIGGVVFVVDTALFQGLLFAAVALPAATTIGYVAGVSTHFALNRAFSFRNFDRTWRNQARTYGAIVFAQWVMTVTVVELLVHGAHAAPFVAKLVAVAANLPVGFLCHRSMTFGPGIRSRLRELAGLRRG